MNEDEVWQGLLALAGGDADHAAVTSIRAIGADGSAGTAGGSSSAWLVDLYLPLCEDCPERLVVGHLGQSLDGRIATTSGASRWLTGEPDLVHNHRMRALFDAVVVGAGTIRNDDPQLTVRAVEGQSPVRVILDQNRQLSPGYRVFNDGIAPTILVCDQACAGAGLRCQQADVLGAPVADGRLCPHGVLERLAARGLKRIFVEGGGLTISNFLGAGCLHRLQITVAPVIIGSGRPGITLPEIDEVSAALRPPTRRFVLGEDVLFECRFDG